MASPPTLGAGLDLFRADRETWLLDQPATYGGVDQAVDPCPDPPELLVDTQNPNDSLILKQIQGRQSCGDPEPRVGILDPDEQACIEAWVLALAQRAQ